MNKCSVLSIPTAVDSPLYFLSGVAVPCLNCYVDPGVIIVSKLSFEARIDSTMSKARQRISILFLWICYS